MKRRHTREKRLSRRPVGWESKKDIGKRTTLASRLSCSRRAALVLPNTWLQGSVVT